MLMHGKTREPPSTKWIVIACTASFLLYLVVWWISAPSSSSSPSASANDEPRIFVSQERYLQQAETIVGRLVRLNPLELRAQLQTVIDQLDGLERSGAGASDGEAKQALTREPRDLVDQYLALTRTATKSMSDLVQLVSELKAEYHIQRLNAVV